MAMVGVTAVAFDNRRGCNVCGLGFVGLICG